MKWFHDLFSVWVLGALRVETLKHLVSLILPNLDAERDGLLAWLRILALESRVHIHESLLEDTFAENPIELVEVHLIVAWVWSKLALYDFQSLIPKEFCNKWHLLVLSHSLFYHETLNDVGWDIKKVLLVRAVLSHRFQLQLFPPPSDDVHLLNKANLILALLLSERSYWRNLFGIRLI